MDQAYLEWLEGLPSLGREKGRRVAERFPTFEHLRTASRDELASVEGLTPRDVDAILGLVRPEGPGEGSADLFLCPECGSFTGAKATTCAVCGASFGEGEEPATSPEEPASEAPVPKAEPEAVPAGNFWSRPAVTEPPTPEPLPPEPLAPEVPPAPDPDRAYLEWLLSLPRMGEEKARKIAAQFPTFEHLRTASRDELASVEGLAPEDLEALGSLLGDIGGGKKSGALFLCPECGSFAGKDAAACPICGAEFGPEEASVLSEADAFIESPEETKVLDLCLACGAFMSSAMTRCGVCGRERAPGERVVLPGVDVPSDEPVPFCPHCGAYLYADTPECVICGRSVAEPPEAVPTNGQGRGIGKGFLSRWKRVSEAGPAAEEDRLREELEHFERLLEADPNLEKVWAKRARVLGRLGRTKEAAGSLARAGELNPAKDDDYRVEVLDLLRAQGDVSFLPPRWRQPAATAAPPAFDPRLLDALRHYEDLLRVDPGLEVAWRTKGEILGRLGREAEAREAFERAQRLEAEEDRERRTSLSGLQTRGMVSDRGVATGRTNGRVNGRTNGRTNGRVNGRTNGRVNGVVEGRVNGLTNGAVNGLTFGRGATNGLVNGNGFTNGRRGRFGPAQLRPQPHWSRSVAGIAAVVALMVLAPILASFLSPLPPAPSLIRIDQDFSDWAGLPAYVDSPSDMSANADVNLLATKVYTTETDLYVYAQIQGVLFRGAGNGTESLFVFVDEDGDPTTGYPIGDLGADLIGEVYGWDASITGSLRAVFNRTAGGTSDDWSRFLARGGVEAAARAGELELRITLDRGPADAKVLVYLADAFGNRDAADTSIRPARASVVVEQRTVAPDVAASNRTAFLRIALIPNGGTPFVTAINVTRLGTSSDPATLRLYEDDGSGSLDPADAFVGQAALAGGLATVPVGRALSAPAIFWLEAELPSFTPMATFGLRVADVWSDGATSLRAPETGLAYLGAAPPTLAVDGAFGDWSGRTYGQDFLGDVVNRTGSAMFNGNVDMVATAVDVGANFTAFARVDGRILGGEDIPTARARTSPATPVVDSDLDGVPDAVEITLPNPELRFDFNNDNVTDNRTNGDVDGDGILDYPDGPDVWLNTTIPSWFPAPYAGRVVTRYIGPIAPTVQKGVDVVYAYVDADNSTSTGLRTDVEGQSYGFDYALAVVGRNGAIREAGLYEYAPGAGTPWRLLQTIDAALDAYRLEFGVDAAALALSPGYRVVFFASDWRLNYDAALPDAAVARFPVGVRAVTNVLINEVSPSSNPEWVEVVNPTTAGVSLSGWNLAIVRGNKIVTVFSFSNQVLGAWGSGSEYLSVTLGTNALPNANAQLLLRNGATVVDAVTYGAVASSRSSSRFKDPLTGVPMDTNTDADFYMSFFPSLGQGNDRHRPTFAFAKTSSATAAAPGDTVTYTIYYNNTDKGMAKHVWVNDTLPAGVTFTSASPTPTTVSGSTVSWHFADVLPNAFNAVTVTLTLNAGLTDGATLVNSATLAYTDQLRRPLAGIQAWANVTVSRPVITVVKTATPANALPGDLVTFTIWYNNTGSAPAGTVTIKDVLPSGLTFVSASPAPTWMDGTTFYWNFTDVAPGSYSISVVAQVEPTYTGTELVNWIFLNYTTANGFPLESSSASSVVAIPELTDFVFVAAVPFLLLMLRRRAARREKKERSG